MNWRGTLDLQMEQYHWQVSEIGMEFTTGFFLDFLGKKVEKDYPERARLGDAYKLASNLVAMLWRADTMFVTAEMQHLLLQASHDLPSDVTYNIQNLITPMGFCQFEETIYGKDVNDSTIAISAIAWHTAPVKTYYNEDTGEYTDIDEPKQVIAIYFFTPTDDMSDDVNREMLPKMREMGVPIAPLAVCHFYPALEGNTVPEGVGKGSEIIIGLIKMFLAIQFIGHQPIGEPIKMRPDRAARKRFARMHPDEPERLISLITLRRKRVAKDDHEPQKVEWSRRWVVRGFWRKQWYPKAKIHDWKYIHEYIKGPEDKPLVITERRVFNFRR